MSEVKKQGPNMAPGPRGPRGGGPGFRSVEKPKDIKKTLRRLLNYMKDYRLQLVIVFVALILSSLAGVAGTYFLKPIINGLVAFVGQDSPDLSGFIRTLLIMGIIYAAGRPPPSSTTGLCSTYQPAR